MSIIPKLATSLNRRDEVPNQDLAKEISKENNKAAVKELFENLENKNKNIQSDCIKVIYEIGELKPELIKNYAKELIKLLKQKQNRLQWGAMHALNAITYLVPEKIYESLGEIIESADKGSVITNDHCVRILAKLGTIKKYIDDVLPLLLERIKLSPVNQFASYAEAAMPVMNDKYKAEFLQILNERLMALEQEPKRKRIQKILNKLRV